MPPETQKQFDLLSNRVKQLEDTFRSLQNPSEVDPQIVKTIVASVSLNDLRDVDTTGVVDGEVIKYEASSDSWINAPDIDT